MAMSFGYVVATLMEAIQSGVVFLKPQARSFFNRNKAPIELAEPLLNALNQVLAETPEISDITWSNDYDI